MKGMKATVLRSIFEEERMITRIDDKHFYCRYERKRTETTIIIKDDGKKVLKKKSA